MSSKLQNLRWSNAEEFFKSHQKIKNMNYDFVQHITEVQKLQTMKKVLKDMKARMDIRNEFVGKAGSEYFRRNQEMKPVYQIGIDKCEARIKQLSA